LLKFFDGFGGEAYDFIGTEKGHSPERRGLKANRARIAHPPTKEELKN